MCTVDVQTLEQNRDHAMSVVLCVGFFHKILFYEHFPHVLNFFKKCDFNDCIRLYHIDVP